MMSTNPGGFMFLVIRDTPLMGYICHSYTEALLSFLLACQLISLFLDATNTLYYIMSRMYISIDIAGYVECSLTGRLVYSFPYLISYIT